MFAKVIFLVGIVSVSAQSWQNYVDDQLLGAGMEKAVIFDFNGEILAQSSNIQATTDETTRIVEQFDDPGSVFATGIKLGGVKYLGIKGDPQSIYGKKGAGGIICAKTEQVVICGTYDYSLQPGNAALVVEKLGDYLRDTGN